MNPASNRVVLRFDYGFPFGGAVPTLPGTFSFGFELTLPISLGYAGFIAALAVAATRYFSWRAAVGVVTQRTEVLVGTLAENVALFGDVPRERIEAAVRELGLETWVAGLPDGLDTRLGPGGTSLSAGEEQLVAFARLLVRDVSVVVLDEATARMDPLTEARVVGAAERLLVGRTGLLVAHRLTTVRHCDIIVELEDGRVVAKDTYEQLIERSRSM